MLEINDKWVAFIISDSQQAFNLILRLFTSATHAMAYGEARVAKVKTMRIRFASFLCLY